MSCPNCGSSMSVKVFENQTILHCGNCGASFFEENGINRITVAEAEKLASIKETDDVSGNDKLCMKDGSVMKTMSTGENIPPEVTLLQCPQCKSIFVFSDDLVAFKQAQVAKLNYFKAWNIPLPSLSAIVVLSFVALIAASFFSVSIYFHKNSINTTQADEVIKKIYVSKSGQYIFLNFSTIVPVKSEVVFKDITTGKTVLKVISPDYQTLHYLTTGDLNPTDELFYKIIIKDSSGREIKSEERKL